MSTSPAVTSRGPVEAPDGAGSGSMMKSSPDRELDLLPGAVHYVVDVAWLERLEEEQRVVAVDGVGAKPGVEAVKVGEPCCQVRHDPAEQLGPGDQLLQHRQVGDRGAAVRVGGGPWPQAGRGAGGSRRP
jgi:hypothetical protein